MSLHESLPAWLAAALDALARGDIGGWMTIYADDAVHEFPFAPPDGVRLLQGREAIAAYMGGLPEMVRFGSLDGIRCREAGEETIIEAKGHHRRLPGGTPMTLDYVWFITRRDGRVVHFRDYMNPLQLASG